MITAGKDDSLFKSYVSECTTKLFDKMGGFNVDPHEFLDCQLIGFISQWQLFILENSEAIEQAEKIMLKVICKQSEFDLKQDFIDFVTSSIQSDIRQYVYIGGVMSKNKEVSFALYDYFINYRETLINMGHFYEVNYLSIALLCSQHLFEFSHEIISRIDCSMSEFVSFYVGGSIIKAYLKYITENINDFTKIDNASEAAREIFAYVIRADSLNYSPLSTDYLQEVLNKIDEIKQEIKKNGIECHMLIKFRYHIEIKENE